MSRGWNSVLQEYLKCEQDCTLHITSIGGLLSPIKREWLSVTPTISIPVINQLIDLLLCTDNKFENYI